MSHVRAPVSHVRAPVVATPRVVGIVGAVVVALLVTMSAWGGAALTNSVGGGSPRHAARALHPGDVDPGEADRPAGAGGGAATGGAQPAGAGLTAELPTFGTPPQAVPITLPPGPDAPFLARIPTDQPVAFLTIDDGWTKRPEAIQLMAAAHVPVTLFLTINAIHSDPAYFAKLEPYGAVIEAHTITHRSMRGMPYAEQRQEACGSADQLGTLYGRRPILFRPPFGNKDETTLQVVHDCGMKAAFFWKETVDKGLVRYQEGHTVERGDIILMHFRPAFAADFVAALQAIHAAGLTPALLENYLPK